MTTPVPFYANLSNDIEIEYLCNIRQEKAHNIHYLEDKKVLVLRNHQEGSGNHVNLKQSKASLIEREPSVLLTLKEFNVDDVTESGPVCHSCLKDVLDINKSQTKEKISSLICLYSKICGHIVRNFAKNGVEFNCSYETMLKACDGFTRLLDFDLEACFSCPNCGTSPEYFVGDGKADIAPLQTKLQGIGVKELSAHPEDKIPLEQGSLHKERIFIPEKKERDIFCELVTDGVTLKDFLKDRNVKQLKSENSKLLVKIIKKQSVLQSLPDCYKSLIAELVKNSPVAGLIQTTSKRALVLLKQFLKRKLDLLDGSHQSELKFLRSELLGFLPLLLEICDFEKQNFLPGLTDSSQYKKEDL